MTDGPRSPNGACAKTATNRRNVGRLDHAYAALEPLLPVEPRKRGRERLGRVALAVRPRREGPAGFRHAANRRLDEPVEIGEAEVADIAARRLLANRPVAITQQRPQPAIREHAHPRVARRGRLAVEDVLDDLGLGPHRGERIEVAERMAFEDEARRVENGRGRDRRHRGFRKEGGAWDGRAVGTSMPRWSGPVHALAGRSGGGVGR